MKKVFLYASVFALAVSCTDNEFDSAPVQNNSKGIDFVSVVEEPTTREEITAEGHIPFWYAEQDHIGITSINTAIGAQYDNQTIAASWATPNTAEYKATKSQRDGEFTAVGNTDILWFSRELNDKTGAFVTTAPSTPAVAYTATNLTYNSPIKSAQVQTGNNGQGVFANMFQIGLATGELDKPYDAVGEKVNLSMTRQNATVIMNVVKMNEFSEDFGKLSSVKLATDPTNGSVLVTDNSTFVVTPETDLEKFGQSKIEFKPSTTASDAKKEITLSFPNPIEWNDDSYAYIATDPVTRSGKKDVLNIEYSFENITLNLQRETSNNWAKGRAYGPITLDVLEEYKYLVTNGDGAGSGRSLIIIDASFADIISDSNGEVKWPVLTQQDIDNGVSQITVPLTEFTSLKVTPLLSDNDLERIKGFTNLKSVSLAENTNIPANTFAGLNDLVKIVFPKATTIDSQAFEANRAFEHVELPAYEFGVAATRNAILTNSKASLKVLNMSAVKSMGNIFPAAGFTLNGYNVLEEVTVMNGIRLGGGAFQGCASLTKLTGEPVLVGSYAFAELTGGDAPKLKGLTVTLENGKLPDGAFKGNTTLEKLNVEAPAQIGANAFEGCTGFKTIDLSKATIIGKQAFKGSSLTGNIVDITSGNKIVEVYAEVIAFEAFADIITPATTPLYINFISATSIENDILKGTTVSELQFKEAFTYTGVSDPNTTTFGNSLSTKLYVNSGQQGVEGITLFLKGSDDNAVGRTFTFVAIERL